MNATDVAMLRRLWDAMLVGRGFDQAMSAHNPSWHESRGEEATFIGAFAGLREDDVVAPHYRGACGVAIMRGNDAATVAEGVFGKQGFVGGAWRGDVNPAPSRTQIGFFSGSLGTSVAYAGGAALALKQRGGDLVTVASFGDGTANAGIVSETMNMAAMLRLPLVLVCQDNQWATSLSAKVALAGGPVSDRARAFGLAAVDVDGNDVGAVHAAQAEAVARARAGGGPTLIHASTYRMGGHYMNDPETYRSAEEKAAWGRKDPVARAEAQLVDAGAVTAEAAAAHRRSVYDEQERIVLDARSAPEPEPGRLASSAYASEIGAGR